MFKQNNSSYTDTKIPITGLTKYEYKINKEIIKNKLKTIKDKLESKESEIVIETMTNFINIVELIKNRTGIKKCEINCTINEYYIPKNIFNNKSRLDESKLDEINYMYNSIKIFSNDYLIRNMDEIMYYFTNICINHNKYVKQDISKKRYIQFMHKFLLKKYRKKVKDSIDDFTITYLYNFVTMLRDHKRILLLLDELEV